MPLDLSTVAIVLDAGFGAQLHELAARMPVWIVDTPGNRASIESEWTRRRHDGAERELSVFRTIDGLSPSEHVAALMRTIEAQHGPSAQQPPFTTLLVIGAPLDAAMSSAVRNAGCDDAVPDANGFRAAVRR